MTAVAAGHDSQKGWRSPCEDSSGGRSWQLAWPRWAAASQSRWPRRRPRRHRPARRAGADSATLCVTPAREAPRDGRTVPHPARRLCPDDRRRRRDRRGRRRPLPRLRPDQDHPRQLRRAPRPPHRPRRGPARRPAGALTPEDYAAVMDRWDGAAAATWNRHLSALTSFTAWAGRQEILATNPGRRLERRKPACRGDRSGPRARLDKLFTDDRNDLRERVLWRMLHETAARAGELLSLDIEDLDLEFRRGRVRSKGGAIEYVHWATVRRPPPAPPVARPHLRPGGSRRSARPDLGLTRPLVGPPPPPPPVRRPPPRPGVSRGPAPPAPGPPPPGGRRHLPRDRAR